MGCGESKNASAVQNPKVDISTLMTNNKAPSPQRTPRKSSQKEEPKVATIPQIEKKDNAEPIKDVQINPVER